MLFLLVSLVVFVISCIDPASAATYCPAQSSSSYTHSWRLVSSVDSQSSDRPSTLPISFALAHNSTGFDRLRQFVSDSSSPQSQLYGHYLTYDEIIDWTSPSLSTVQSLLDHLIVTLKPIRFSISLDRLWIRGDFPIETIEQLLHVQFEPFIPIHSTGTEHIHSTDSVHSIEPIWRSRLPPQFPKLWSQIIDFVIGIDDFPVLNDAFDVQSFPPSKGSQADDDSAGSQDRASGAAAAGWPPGNDLTLAAIRQLYGIDSTPLKNPHSATASVFELQQYWYAPRHVYIGESYNPSDLTQYQMMNELPIQSIPINQFLGNYPIQFGCPNFTCAEPVLDIEMLYGITINVNLTYWTMAFVAESGNTFLQWLLILNQQVNEPLSWIHSISYGPPECHLSPVIAQRIDQELVKATARGMTFVSSSGDDGVNSRNARENMGNCGLSPQYPVGHPLVTAVGGTFGPEYGKSEVVSETDIPGMPALTTSGGGFSMYFAQPQHQYNAVQAYLHWANTSNPPNFPSTNSFNASNRGYPDVSLVSNNIWTITDGYPIATGGTSASAPIFAGILLRILDERFTAGLGPLGSVNAALYDFAVTVPEAFHDIISGNNRCTGIYGPNRAYTCCPEGFTATKGWDPASGLGSIVYSPLRDAFLKAAHQAQQKRAAAALQSSTN